MSYQPHTTPINEPRIDATWEWLQDRIDSRYAAMEPLADWISNELRQLERRFESYMTRHSLRANSGPASKTRQG